MAITKMQEDFCKYLAVYDMKPAEAYYAAGYPHVNTNAELFSNIHRLLSNKSINDEVERLREKCFDIDKVRRDLILEHEQTRDMDLTSVMEPVEYVDDNGNYQTRLAVKPISEWSPALRKACIGFDRYGVPKFRDKGDAAKELSRLYGLYKDNTVVVQQDLEGIINDAIGDESNNLLEEITDEVVSPDVQDRDSKECQNLDDVLLGKVEQPSENCEDILSSML